MKRLLMAALLGLAAPAWADAVDTLREFVRDVKSGRAEFTQTVTSPDGARQRSSSGRFEFLRPNRFRFDYLKPFEQHIVADGRKVWVHDADLDQVTVRNMDQALGATPAALLAGTGIERDFQLKALPDAEGLQWVEALPRTKEGQFQSLRIGFRGRDLGAIEILDSFGQRSRLNFSRVESNVAIAPESFRYTPPPGVDVLPQ
ncbi:outer membrane lipoprotein chaperone LolA [Caldimonas tepidiphila]|uniref:outer membrane lipoprotein chaperone LolA n=1 Tax=Caldimonas tepidiphila TaxID=2315841 RepID=UPI000E5AF1F4|nr:outer membrane lipoprotein chaperone LolA [Caldimonas tepidiphila]